MKNGHEEINAYQQINLEKQDTFLKLPESKETVKRGHVKGYYLKFLNSMLSQRSITIRIL